MTCTVELVLYKHVQIKQVPLKPTELRLVSEMLCRSYISAATAVPGIPQPVFGRLASALQVSQAAVLHCDHPLCYVRNFESCGHFLPDF